MPSGDQDRPNSQEIASYYDSTLVQRLRDYVYGNERIAAAIELADSVISRSTRNLLEVGCGLGISAAELAAGRDWLTVHAVDISPKSIEAATQLFGTGNLVFEVSDLQDVPRMAPYDLITLLDVYEHIPRDSWPRFHAVISNALAPDGILVLTTPTPLHQEYLARNHPGGLQVIDETVHLEDLAGLARAVGGMITYYNYVSIWRNHDYCHAIIKRNPADGPRAQWVAGRSLWRRAAGRLGARWAGWKGRRASAVRRQRVYSRLGVQV